jgi:VWFA-related protein
MILALFALAAVSLAAQSSAPDANAPVANLRISSHAVLLDVVVTDKSGKPVSGLKQDAFSVLEQGKPQSISFFEEHTGPEAPAGEMPALPPNVFSNFSPMGRPAAVNVLLLDSLNTQAGNQMEIHRQALNFLKTLKPGSRMAIFTMSMGLSYVQGFTDDPALLVAALDSKKKTNVDVPVLMNSSAESNAQQGVIGQMSEIIPGPATPGGSAPPSTSASPAMISAMQGFMEETQEAQTADRELRTLTNLQQLAAFLGSFPGRKNLIWFSESFPTDLFGATAMRYEEEIKKTINLLTVARVAVYPVDARGVVGNSFFEAGNTTPAGGVLPGQLSGGNGPGSNQTTTTQIASPATSEGPQGYAGAMNNPLVAENYQRNGDQETMKMLAEASGGKAFVNANDMTGIVRDIVAHSSDFYTLSYAPTNSRMDGQERKIEVKINGAKYNLSYRHYYYAKDVDLPGTGLSAQGTPTGNPLQPFMNFGMPETEQILYKTLIQPVPAKTDAPADARAPSHFSVDFAVDLKDVDLKQEASGLHTGMLNLSLIVYDRYGNIASRKDHRVALSIKPDAYAAFQQTGLQLHAEIDVPSKGQYWLRTGIFDASARKVGTMEVPLSEVKAMAAVKAPEPAKPAGDDDEDK